MEKPALPSVHTLQDRSSHSLFTDEETEAGEKKTFAQDPTGCE